MRKPENRKVEQLGLSFPYDWSNPNISDFALIWAVLERGIFLDVARICLYFGIAKVKSVWQEMPRESNQDRILSRMFRNIETGFKQAEEENYAG